MNPTNDPTPNVLTSRRSAFLNIDYSVSVDGVDVWLKTWTIGATAGHALRAWKDRHPDAMNVQYKKNVAAPQNREQREREAIKQAERPSMNRKQGSWGYFGMRRVA